MNFSDKLETNANGSARIRCRISLKANEEFDAINLQSIQYLILLRKMFNASNYEDEATVASEHFHFALSADLREFIKFQENCLFSLLQLSTNDSLESSSEFYRKSCQLFSKMRNSP